MEDYKKRFEKGFKILCSGSKSQYKVWDDIIHLYAYSLSNSIMTLMKGQEPFKSIWQEREESYLRIINTYSKREQKIICQMLALLAMEYEREPYQDLLGKIYMMLGISNKNKGQFFTPYDIAKLMADVTFDRKQIGKIVHKKGYASICDESVGAGCTLIAAAEKCDEMFKIYEYRNHVYFVGQDVDETVAMMCYIQLTLLGLPGYVAVGDTLKEAMVKDLRRVYFTPVYFNDVWTGRRMAHGLDIFMCERRKDGYKRERSN